MHVDLACDPFERSMQAIHSVIQCPEQNLAKQKVLDRSRRRDALDHSSLKKSVGIF
jgi:hypothetical protein